MPSQIIHVLSGSRALRSGTVSSSSILPGIFNLGCQGPDIFSHNRRTKPFALAFARLLHRHDYGLFCANFARHVIDGDCGSESKYGHNRSAADFAIVAASWFYGFVTHQVVDRIFHPYIVYRSFVSGSTGIDGVPPERFHVFLERILDAVLFEHLEGKSVSSFDCVRAIRIGDDESLLLSGLIASALAETYPLENDHADDLELRVRNAFSDTLHFYLMTNPSEVGMELPPDSVRQKLFLSFNLGAAALLHPVALDIHTDWLNLSASPWLDPVSGAEYRYSVPELLDRAVTEAESAILAASKVLEGSASPESLEAAFGNGPLSVTGPDGKIGSVQYAAPFDLAPVLLDQAEKRRHWLSFSSGGDSL